MRFLTLVMLRLRGARLGLIVDDMIDEFCSDCRDLVTVVVTMRKQNWRQAYKSKTYGINRTKKLTDD